MASAIFPVFIWTMWQTLRPPEIPSWAHSPWGWQCDSFVAAFCTGLTAGLPQGEALAFASHTAAITVSRMGAMPSLPTLDEVIALLKERDYRGFDLSVLDVLK